MLEPILGFGSLQQAKNFAVIYASEISSSENAGKFVRSVAHMKSDKEVLF